MFAKYSSGLVLTIFFRCGSRSFEAFVGTASWCMGFSEHLLSECRCSKHCKAREASALRACRTAAAPAAALVPGKAQARGRAILKLLKLL